MSMTTKKNEDWDWFTCGFPKVKKISLKQFNLLAGKWEEIKDLLPRKVVILLEASKIAPYFWLASLTRREASNLISYLLDDGDDRVLSQSLIDALHNYQSDSLHKLGAMVKTCPSCTTEWGENIDVLEVSRRMLEARGLSFGNTDALCVRCKLCNHVIPLFPVRS